MPNSTPAERKLSASIAAHTSWANTLDRSLRTSAARQAFEQRFLDEAGGDPARAESLRRAYYKKLALRSVRSRRRAGELLADAYAADTELAETKPGHRGDDQLDIDGDRGDDQLDIDGDRGDDQLLTTGAPQLDAIDSMERVRDGG